MVKAYIMNASGSQFQAQNKLVFLLILGAKRSISGVPKRCTIFLKAASSSSYSVSMLIFLDSASASVFSLDGMYEAKIQR